MVMVRTGIRRSLIAGGLQRARRQIFCGESLVLAVVGNKAVIAQVKSKRLTEVAKIGNETRLGADFKLAVQEAYDQALLCRRALLDRDSNLLVGGKEIHLGESIDDAYILCVTLDHYPAVMHEV